ncbi:helix-turn-helix domain-containing protein [Actinacidiphila soli]|uniref:helix-turn-helix domain-containing protein n=1 Tax=Actinacidiphila soli TaxID=2487275 RepID=UPI000FCAD9C8|nr:helix-turn-helix domain-containing protein [Actinacidiphila soli]
MHVDTVRTWRGRFAAGGLPALADRKRPGRPPRFTPVQVSARGSPPTPTTPRNGSTSPAPASSASTSTPTPATSRPRLHRAGLHRPADPPPSAAVTCGTSTPTAPATTPAPPAARPAPSTATATPPNSASHRPRRTARQRRRVRRCWRHPRKRGMIASEAAPPVLAGPARSFLDSPDRGAKTFRGG